LALAIGQTTAAAARHIYVYTIPGKLTLHYHYKWSATLGYQSPDGSLTASGAASGEDDAQATVPAVEEWEPGTTPTVSPFGPGVKYQDFDAYVPLPVGRGASVSGQGSWSGMYPSGDNEASYSCSYSAGPPGQSFPAVHMFWDVKGGTQARDPVRGPRREGLPYADIEGPGNPNDIYGSGVAALSCTPGAAGDYFKVSLYSALFGGTDGSEITAGIFNRKNVISENALLNHAHRGSTTQYHATIHGNGTQLNILNIGKPTTLDATMTIDATLKLGHKLKRQSPRGPAG
jgi:hypothetical protein